MVPELDRVMWLICAHSFPVLLLIDAHNQSRCRQDLGMLEAHSHQALISKTRKGCDTAPRMSARKRRIATCNTIVLEPSTKDEHFSSEAWRQKAVISQGIGDVKSTFEISSVVSNRSIFHVIDPKQCQKNCHHACQSQGDVDGQCRSRRRLRSARRL